MNPQVPAQPPEPGPLPESLNSEAKEPKKRFNLKLKYLIPAIALLVLAIGAFFLMNKSKPSQTALNVNQTQTNPKDNQAKSVETSTPKKSIRFVATGDMIAHDALNLQAKQADGSYNYYQFMDKMKPYFDGADIRFCNQAVLGAGQRFGIKGYPVFNSPVEFAQDMSKVGCNLINTGTNHTNDLNQAAIDASVSVWDKLKVLAVAGASRSQQEHDKIRYFKNNGLTFAFLSYSTYTNSSGITAYGLSMYNKARAASQISKARQNADIVIVSMRWGTEYSSSINAQQNQVSQDLSDFGANIVLGHGPHVLEPVKKLQGKNGNTTYVWYSLGNFLNAQLEPEALINGFAVMDIDIDTKKITKVAYLPVYMHYEWTAQEKARQDLLKRKGFEMYLLEDAAEPLKRSQLNVTVAQQTKRLTDTLNKYTKVNLLTKEKYLQE